MSHDISGHHVSVTSHIDHVTTCSIHAEDVPRVFSLYSTEIQDSYMNIDIHDVRAMYPFIQFSLFLSSFSFLFLFSFFFFFSPFDRSLMTLQHWDIYTSNVECVCLICRLS